MSHHLTSILSQWSERKTDTKWALGVIFKIEGHSYRKPGALALYSAEGTQLGILSGGCLEADIRLVAQKAISLDKPIIKIYDGQEETDMSYHLGCGGSVHILILPLTPTNEWLELDSVFKALCSYQAGEYRLLIAQKNDRPKAQFQLLSDTSNAWSNTRTDLTVVGPTTWLTINISPIPHLLIAGGGIDAIPVCQLAKQMGWRVSVWDDRPHYADQQDFSMADTLLRCPVSELLKHCEKDSVHMLVIMSHNLILDAKVVQICNQLSLTYTALLGPKLRRTALLAEAKLTESDLQMTLHSPAGLDIGGELPESIALSIIAQCHSALYGKLA